MPGTPPSWDRDQLGAYADRLLLGVRPYVTRGRAGFNLPGSVSGYGRAVDRLEAFCRTFLLAGFRLTGEHGQDPLGLAEWYAEGIATGTDPGSPDRWVRMSEHDQAKVEAASLALILDMTRTWIWDRLGATAQRNTIAYLAEAVGNNGYPRTNWLWFRLVVQTFLRSVGGPHSLADMREDLALHDSFRRSAGWMSDGHQRNYDHYLGWALHLYPALWARMAGAEDLAAPRREFDRAQLDRYLSDAIRMVGADGAPMIQGRSLIYRFAAAAQFWVGALDEVPTTPLGQLRRAASRIVQHFHDRSVPDSTDVLTLGLYHQWPALAQAYSGTGSPYWAAKGLLGLALPAEHPVWSAPEVRLPSETADELFAVEPAGWIVSQTASDGIARILNHGTDHALPGSQAADSPLYARFGYSSATAPLLHETAWSEPLDNAVVLLDPQGRATHRTGMRVVETRTDLVAGEPLGVVASWAEAHWVEPKADQFHHGNGYEGTSTRAGTLTTISLVRRGWELRLTRAHDLASHAVALRVGGWPLTGEAEVSALAATAAVVTKSLRSRIVAFGAATTSIERRDDASPLGSPALVPVATFWPQPGAWLAVLVELTGAPAPAEALSVSATTRATGTTVAATWPDGRQTITFVNITDPDGGVGQP
ncbi:MAG: DUF2264 domain-containing protein [Arachnia sp.]